MRPIDKEALEPDQRRTPVVDDRSPPRAISILLNNIVSFDQQILLGDTRVDKLPLLTNVNDADHDVIELYHCVDARSFRALWALEELGLGYRLHLLPFPPRASRPEFLELNPLGTVPLLVDGEVRMTESAAITQYLAARYGPTPLAVGPGEPDHGLWLDWLHRSDATLTFPLTIVLRYARLEPEERRLAQAVDDYTQWFLSRLRHLTRALEDRQWLCAGRFTMADLCVGYALLFARDLGLAHKFSPAISAYWERLNARPGFAAAKAAQSRAMAAADGQIEGEAPL